MLTDPFKQKLQKKSKNFIPKKLIRKVSILDSYEQERKIEYKNKSINLLNQNKDLYIKNTNLITSNIKQNLNTHYRSITNNITMYSNETNKIKKNLTEFIAKKSVINLSDINLKMVQNFPHQKEKGKNEINSLTINRNSLMTKKRKIISKELNVINNNNNCKSNDDYNNYFGFSKIMNKMSFSIPVTKRKNRPNNNLILLYDTTMLKTRENLLTKIILEIDKKQLLKYYFNNWVNKYNSSTIKLDKISYFFDENKKNNGFLSLGDYLRISDIFAKRKNKKIILSIISKKDKHKKPLFKNHTYLDTYKQSYQKSKKLGSNYIKIDLDKRTNNKTII